MAVYYNEYDPGAAAWLRRLMAAGKIPDGWVDDRSICDVKAADLSSFTQCHFFAGVGGWAQALRLADWPEDQSVFTGSCPCQPFSNIGKHGGESDDRHLWPEFARLIGERKPIWVFGEQVESAAGRQWLAGVFNDLEGLGYWGDAADLCAACAGAPHIRQRIYWGAKSKWSRVACVSELPDGQFACRSNDAVGEGLEGHSWNGEDPCQWESTDGPAPTSGFWDAFELASRSDKPGMHSRVEPGVSPLAYGIPRDVGPLLTRMGELGIDSGTAKRLITNARYNHKCRLRGYGNAIVPDLGALFVRAFLGSL